MNSELVTFLQIAGKRMEQDLAMASRPTSNWDDGGGSESKSSTTSTGDLPYDVSRPFRVIKRPREEMSTGNCSVCEAPNSAFHFGTIACAACSAFFRRTIAERRQYSCRRDETGRSQCPINQQHRCYCRACRLAKCLEKGMDPSGVQPHRDSIGNNKPPNVLTKRCATADIVSVDWTSKKAKSAEPEDFRACERPPSSNDGFTEQLKRLQERLVGLQDQQTSKVFGGTVDVFASATQKLLTANPEQRMAKDQLMMLSLSPFDPPRSDVLASSESTYSDPTDPSSPATFNGGLFADSQSYDWRSVSSTPSAGSGATINCSSSIQGLFPNLIERLLHMYQQMFERRRLFYCNGSLRDILSGAHTRMRPMMFREKYFKDRLRFEMSLFVEFINCIESFSQLDVDSKVALVQHGAVAFSLFERYYYTMKMGGLTTKRIISPDGTYINLADNGAQFREEKIEGVIMDKETCLNYFYMPLMDNLHELSGAMFNSQMTDVEFCAVCAVLFFDPSAPRLPTSARQTVQKARDALYTDWFQYYAKRGISTDEASEIVGNSMLLLPALKVMVEKSREGFHLIRVFDIIQYDKLMEDLM